MSSIGPYVGFKFKAIIPKSLWGTRLNELLPEHFFSYFISLLAAFDHGVKGSVCFTSLSFLLNWPRTISLALSQITVGCTLSYCNIRDNALWASLFSFIGNKCDKPKSVTKICAYLLPLLYAVGANSVSLYTLCGNLSVITDDHLS